MKFDIILKGSPLFQFLATFLGNLNVIAAGLQYGWPSKFLPQLQSIHSTIHITNDEGSTLVVIMVAGTISGSLITRFMIDWLGRKTCIILATIPMLISCIILGFASTLEELIAGRYLAGISDGMAYSTMNVYISEIANYKYRGFLGSLVGFSYTLGILVMTIIGSYFNFATSALLSVSLPVIVLLTFPWMPESPYFLILKNKKAEARRVLIKLNGKVNGNLDFIRISEAVEEQIASKKSFCDVCKLICSRRTLLTIIIILCIHQATGYTAILFYAETIFQKAGDAIPAQDAALIFMGLQLVVCILSSAVVDKVGRKPLLIVSLTGSGLSLLALAGYFCSLHYINIEGTNLEILPVVAMIMYIIIFNMGLQTIPHIMIGEIFPTIVKPDVTNICNIGYALIIAIVSKYFQFTKDRFGMEVPLFTFAGFCGLGLICVIFIITETKGKTLETIQSELNQSSPTSLH